MELHKLKAGTLAKLGNGLHNDGGGLYLQVTGNSRSWQFRFKPRAPSKAVREKLGLPPPQKWSRGMGLGSLDVKDAGTSLALARELAADARRQLTAGIDPIDHRNKERAKDAAKHKRVPSFRDYAIKYVASHEVGWSNPKHRQQWRNTLGLPGGGKLRMTYCDSLHSLKLDAIDTAAVRKVLDPIWHILPETASRIRGRIERILDAATTDGHRSGPNPARWQGHLSSVYPSKRKVRAVRHQPALPWPEIPDFVAKLREREGVAERCVEFLILTAVRSQEARGARFDEIDFDAARWVIPAARMKRGMTHAVPLSKPALALLERMKKTRLSPFVFPGGKRGTAISDTSMRNVLRDMGIAGDKATCHGMRSSFRDFAAEATHAPNIVAEKALAHGVSDGTEAAYRRGDLFEKRRELMDTWGRFCAGAKPRALKTAA